MISFKGPPSGSFKKSIMAAAKAAEIAATKGMRTTAADLKGAVRSEIVSAGLGRKLANSVRSIDYPKSGTSLNPAGVVVSKAPHILDAYENGVTIGPKRSRYLAIPTPDAPKGRGGRKLKVREAIERFGEARVIKDPTSGRLCLVFFTIAALSGKGQRRATAGRLKQGRRRAAKIFFFLIPAVRLPKKLDVAAALHRTAARLKPNIAAAWPTTLEALE